MLYVKNVPNAERIVRVLMGIGLLAAALTLLGRTSVGWTVGVMGLMATLTGLVGWCPMCAMVGRKLNSTR